MATPHNYSVGWICAIEPEYLAAQLCFDGEPEALLHSPSPNDSNAYSLGTINGHKVVIACLPRGSYGTTSAAIVSANMLRSFPNIKVGLMVGLGGGAPTPDADIRLGDIVVSTPGDGQPGVLQYDYGRTVQGQEFELTGALNRPPTALLTAVTNLNTEFRRKPKALEEAITDILEKLDRELREDLTRPDVGTDVLYQAGFTHPVGNGGACADLCGLVPERLTPRQPRSRRPLSPVVHYGLVASGNQLMKDAKRRDELAQKHKVLCFEMEAAGLMNDFPCLVIRGICDYSDSHKSKVWQDYAALAAAVYARELLCRIPPSTIEAEKKASEVMSTISDTTARIEAKIDNSRDLQNEQIEISRILDQKFVLDKLIRVNDATFDSRREGENPTCLEGTRVNLLKEISDWANDPGSEAIFWLNGKAGTGKSTISRTIAFSFAKAGELGASFFFKRGEGSVGSASHFCSTIASQLASTAPTAAHHIRDAIDSDPEICQKAIKIQFEKLILEPLSKIDIKKLVIVVDALDECDSETDIKIIIDLFAHTKSSSPTFKVFLTSRPELPIRLGFRQIHGKYKGFALHEISKSVVWHDITKYLTHELSEIRDDYNNDATVDRWLPSDWPGLERIRDLVKITDSLFIVAATICRFVRLRALGHPEYLLAMFIDQQGVGQASQFHATYLPILNQLLVMQTTAEGPYLLGRLERDTIIQEFRDVIGSIVLLETPLSSTSLTNLLGLKERVIDTKLGYLHSVLNIPSNPSDPIRLFHKSFRDFLVDVEMRERNPFWVDEKVVNKKLVSQCLRLMKGSLYRDICHLGHLGARRSEVDPRQVERCISPELRYACLYWVDHLAHSDSFMYLAEDVHQFLKTHILHWIEALSLLGAMTNAVQSIGKLEGLAPQPYSELSNLIYDAKLFIPHSRWLIENHPLQVYASALIFSPCQSIMRRLFEQEELSWISNKPFTEGFWNPRMQTLEGHRGTVSSVAFSSDGRFVVSGSYDRNVKIWDTRGNEIHTLKGHAGEVNSIACSSDSRLIASGSEDRTVKIWDAATGHEIRTLLSHCRGVHSVGFSSDGRYIVSGSVDKTVRVWNAFTGQAIRKLDILPGLITTVQAAFSGDGRFVLAISRGAKTLIKIWDAATGQMVREVSYHETAYSSVALSSNCRLVVTGSKPVVALEDLASLLDHRPMILLETPLDYAVRVLDELEHGTMGTGDPIDMILSVDSSNDGRYVASGSTDQGVKIWDAVTGHYLQTLMEHSGCVQSVAFSKDGKFVVSGSSDRLVKIWMVNPSREGEAPEYHGNTILPMTVSRDGMLVALVRRSSEAGKGREYITIWGALTGREVRKITHHLEDGSRLGSVAFSSDGRLVAAILLDPMRSFKIWDVDTGRVVRTFSDNAHPTSSQFCPTFCLNHGFYRTVEIWNVATGHTVGVLNGHGATYSIAFSGDDRFLASGTSRNCVKIWEIATSYEYGELRGHCVASLVALSSDGGLAVVVYGDSTTKIWHVATGTEIQTLGLGTMLRAFPSSIGPLYPATGSEYDPLGQDDTPTSVANESESGVELRLQVRELTKGYGVTLDRTWITWNGSPVLWLPQEYRPTIWAASPLGIAIQTARRRLIILRFTGPPRSN